MMMLDRLCDVLDAASSAVSSVDMRLACCQLVVMNVECLLLHQHHHRRRHQRHHSGTS